MPIKGSAMTARRAAITTALITLGLATLAGVAAAAATEWTLIDGRYRQIDGDPGASFSTGYSPGAAPQSEEERLAPGPKDDAQAMEDASPIAPRVVAFPGYGPGEVVIDTADKRLYFVLPDGRSAIAYGIGVGREGFAWRGIERVSAKRPWPDWTPPNEMLARRPDLPVHMDGGLNNPLGARALYLGATLYRIHGTNEPDTIGHNVSSGCIRLANRDIIDLYARVAVGAKVTVK
jgi:lipoprotein-anchoring transpeptidase ErfK/SrfK